jgi:hypothetical protein
MTSWQAASEDSPTGADGAFRAIGLAAVFIGVAALAAATFVLSYQGIRAVALHAGIEPRYAKGYPLLIDAMLVIVLAAVLALRGAGLPSRMLAWLTLLVVLCAAAGADTLHATGRTLPHTAGVVTAAVLPWALVFVAFVLLLAMLRHARLRRQVNAALAQVSRTPQSDNGQDRSQQNRSALPPPLPVRSPQPWQSASVVPGLTSQLVSAAAAGAAAGAAVADVEPPAEEVASDDGHVQLADPDQDATAPEATEPVSHPMAAGTDDETEEPEYDVSLAEAGTFVPAVDTESAAPSGEAEPLTDGPHPLGDAPDPLTDQADRLTDQADRLTDEPEPPTDEPEPPTDEPEPPTDESEPPTDESEPPTDALDTDTEEAQAQPAEDDNDIPAFRRIRRSPTPPED